MADDKDQSEGQILKKYERRTRVKKKSKTTESILNILLALPGPISYLAGGAIQITLILFLVTLVTVIGITPVLFTSLKETDWKKWIINRENLKNSIWTYRQLNSPLYRSLERMYCDQVLAQRDTALAEERIELAAALTIELENCFQK